MTEINRYSIIETIHDSSYEILRDHLNGASDEDLLEKTEDLIVCLMRLIPFYEMKKFRVRLGNENVFPFYVPLETVMKSIKDDESQ